MINICEYGVPKSGIWLLRTMEILFWVYVCISAIASAGMYLILWSTLYVSPSPHLSMPLFQQLTPFSSPPSHRVFPVHMMTPTWVFPAYPLLLTAPLAANLIASADSSGHPLSLNMPAVAFGAATTQGTGCLIAFMISAAFIYRLMTQKLPRDMQRPGVVRAKTNLHDKNSVFSRPNKSIVHLHRSIWLHRRWNRYTSPSSSLIITLLTSLTHEQPSSAAKPTKASPQTSLAPRTQPTSSASSPSSSPSGYGVCQCGSSSSASGHCGSTAAPVTTCRSK